MANDAAATDEPSPLDKLELMAMQTARIAPGLDHLELYTMKGLLSVLWHGDAELENVIVCVGGAMGGLLGPDGALYQKLGDALPAMGIGVVRVGYRKPNDFGRCIHDTLAVMELVTRHGGRRFVTLGHSFGGAVAVQAAAHLDRRSVPGVVTFATQSAGCEAAEQLGDRDLLFFHGTADTILPSFASEMVRMMAGTGELVLLEGADHMLAPSGEAIFERLIDHLPGVFASSENSGDGGGASDTDDPSVAG